MQATLRVMIAILAVALGVALVTIYKMTDDTNRLQREVRAMEQKVETARDRVKTLEAELATLEDPQRIARLARERLGMVPARPDQRVTLDEAERRAWPRTVAGNPAPARPPQPEPPAARAPE
jgi:cell division protein FtsL